jgi:hypothetical protein
VVGASGECAPNDATKCVVGQGSSVLVGTSVSGATIVVECTAAATVAALTELTCFVPGEDIRQTRSFPTTSSASVMITDVGYNNPREVCWIATANFADPFGAAITVVDEDCAIISG